MLAQHREFSKSVGCQSRIKSGGFRILLLVFVTLVFLALGFVAL